MDFISGASSLLDTGAEAYGDWKRGRAIRLGSYKGSSNVKQFGQYGNGPSKRFQTQAYV